MTLRDYQQTMVNRIYQTWVSVLNVLCVLATAAGKSVIISYIVKQESDKNNGVCVIAHRQELVSQMSMHLARDGIYHDIIGSTSLVRMVTNMHLIEYGKVFYKHSSQVKVAGVDTIIRRGEQLKKWLPTVTLWICDEAHHIVGGGDNEPDKDNKWGKAVKMFPNARGLGVTATPLRLDGKGLGRHADGCFDEMIVGESMRSLINRGFLTDYRIFSPATPDFSRENIKVTASGELNKDDVNNAVNNSGLVAHDGNTITGDVVKSYIKFANGKLGVTFVPSLEIGAEITREYNLAGIPAELLSSNTLDIDRMNITKRFERREILQIVNVDILGEGYDCPAIEVVSMARPTASFGLFVQQFGRDLRLLPGKTHGIIIDHVGNVAGKFGHGLPDSPREWTLDRAVRSGTKGKQKLNPITTCTECAANYERFHKVCPYCHHKPEPVGRNIEQVDGDLEELSPAILRALRGEVANIDRPVDEQVGEYIAGLNTNIKPLHAQRHIKLYRKKVEANIEAQRELRDAMARWAGYRRAEGHTDSAIHKLWYVFTNGEYDWLTAQSLECIPADKLQEEVIKCLT